MCFHDFLSRVAKHQGPRSVIGVVLQPLSHQGPPLACLINVQPLINVQRGIWTIESERAASLINVQHGIFLFSYIVSVFSYFLGKTCAE